MEFVDQKEQLLEREFTLRCKVIRKRMGYTDSFHKQNFDADLIILKPEMNAEAELALMAHLPTSNNAINYKTMEIPCIILSGLNMPCKIRPSLPDMIYDKSSYYLVLKKEVEDVFNLRKDVTEVNVKTFPLSRLGEFTGGLIRSFWKDPDLKINQQSEK